MQGTERPAAPTGTTGDVDPNGDIVDRLQSAIGDVVDVEGGQLDAVLRLVAAGRALDAADLNGAEHWRRHGGRR